MLQVELKNRCVAAVNACALELKNAALEAARHIETYILEGEAAIEVAISDGTKALVDATSGTIAHLGGECQSIPVMVEVIDELHRLLGQNPAAPKVAPADGVEKTAVEAVADGEPHEAELH